MGEYAPHVKRLGHFLSQLEVRPASLFFVELPPSPPFASWARCDHTLECEPMVTFKSEI